MDADSTRQIVHPPAWKLWFAELRAPFLLSTSLPVLVGTALAYAQTGRWDWSLFIPAVLGVALCNAMANVFNDYYDHLSGDDALNQDFVRPFTGGSRLIQQGKLSPQSVRRLAWVCATLALLCAAYLVYRGGVVILLIGLVGLVGAYAYSAPPLSLANRGLGEMAVGLNAGLLPLLAAYYLQTGKLAWSAVLVGLPLTLLIVAILFINQFPDYRADLAVGKRNWVVRLGRRQAVPLYAVLVTIWAVPVLGAVVYRLAPPLSLAALVALVPAAQAVRVTMANYETPSQLAPASGLTIVTHLLVAVAQTVALVLAGRALAP